jgi:hypothetical protein
MVEIRDMLLIGYIPYWNYDINVRHGVKRTYYDAKRVEFTTYVDGKHMKERWDAKFMNGFYLR